MELVVRIARPDKDRTFANMHLAAKRDGNQVVSKRNRDGNIVYASQVAIDRVQSNVHRVV
jgi:hypothetical protein